MTDTFMKEILTALVTQLRRTDQVQRDQLQVLRQQNDLLAELVKYLKKTNGP